MMTDIVPKGITINVYMVYEMKKIRISNIRNGS